MWVGTKLVLEIPRKNPQVPLPQEVRHQEGAFWEMLDREGRMKSSCPDVFLLYLKECVWLPCDGFGLLKESL